MSYSNQAAPGLMNANPPDPDELFNGFKMSTEDWLEEFKIYILSTRGNTKDDEWYYHLRNYCSNHPGLNSLLKSMEQHRGNLEDIAWAISNYRHPNGEQSAADYAYQRYMQGIDMPDPNKPLHVLEVH